MATIIVNITDTYTKIADSGAWTSIQNVGVNQIEVFIQDSGGAAPTTGGFILRVLDAMLPTTFGDGDIYAKTRATGLVSKTAIFEE
jgi:hypothetical protein